MVKISFLKYFKQYRLWLIIFLVSLGMTFFWGTKFFVSRIFLRNGISLSYKNLQFFFSKGAVLVRDLDCLILDSQVTFHLDELLVGLNFSWSSMFKIQPAFMVKVKGLTAFCSTSDLVLLKKLFRKKRLKNSSRISFFPNLFFKYLDYVELESGFCKVLQGDNFYEASFFGNYFKQALDKEHRILLSVDCLKNKAQFISAKIDGMGIIEDSFKDYFLRGSVEATTPSKKYLFEIEKDAFDPALRCFGFENQNRFLDATGLIDIRRETLLKNLVSVPFSNVYFPFISNLVFQPKPILFGTRLFFSSQINQDYDFLLDLDVSSGVMPFFNKLNLKFKDFCYCRLDNVLCHQIPILRGEVCLETINTKIDSYLQGISLSNDLGLQDKWFVWLDQRSLFKHFDFGGERLLNENPLLIKSCSNILKSIYGNFFYDRKTARACLNRFEASFDQGMISCSKSFFDLKNYSFGINLSLQDFLFDYPAIVIQGSGNILFRGSIQEKSVVKANLLIDKGFVCLDKMGAFSEDITSPLVIEENFWTKPVSLLDVDLKLHSSDSLIVSLAGESLAVDLSLRVRGSLDEQFDFMKLKTQGQVLFRAENFICAGQKFDAVKGCLDFFDNALNDPLMRLDAWTKIKRYTLFFHVFGVMDDLMVSSRATPYLSEDQILSLLLTGFADRGVGARHLVGTVLSKGSSSWRIGKKSQSLNLLKRITSPLPGFQVAPCVTEIGGVSSPVAASVLIDLGDNLSASLEKDLNSRDDLRLSLEYLLTDNLLFKFNRNYEGVLQGRMEMKFKF